MGCRAIHAALPSSFCGCVSEELSSPFSAPDRSSPGRSRADAFQLWFPRGRSGSSVALNSNSGREYYLNTVPTTSLLTITNQSIQCLRQYNFMLYRELPCVTGNSAFMCNWCVPTLFSVGKKGRCQFH